MYGSSSRAASSITPEFHIIVLSTYEATSTRCALLKAGALAYIALAYILKGHVHRELLDTIRAVHAGQKRIPPEVAAELADHAAEDQVSSGRIGTKGCHHRSNIASLTRGSGSIHMKRKRLATW